MPRLDYKTCRRCKRHASECGVLSHTRLCGDCGPAALAENVYALHGHRGEPFHRWRRAIAASVGAVLLDDGPRDEQTPRHA